MSSAPTPAHSSLHFTLPYGDCNWKEWERGLLVPTVAVEEQGERVCSEFLTCSVAKPCSYWKCTRSGSGAVLLMSGGIFEPIGPIFKGYIAQSTSGALSHVVSMLWVTPVSPSGDRKPVLLWNWVVTWVLTLNRASILQKSFTKNAFPPPVFLSHLPPVSIHFTATSQGRDNLVLKVNFLGRCEQVRQKMGLSLLGLHCYCATKHSGFVTWPLTCPSLSKPL